MRVIHAIKNIYKLISFLNYIIDECYEIFNLKHTSQ